VEHRAELHLASLADGHSLRALDLHAFLHARRQWESGMQETTQAEEEAHG
jgi:hypothetical protein